MLVTTWFADPHRQTRDVDLLGFGSPTPDAMLAVFREVCSVPLDDGVVIDVAGLRVDLIREALEYGGLRLRTTATVAGARVAIVIDIAFGDATEPGIEEIDLPVLLDQPAPRLKAYARETVIAEKFQAMVALGLANTRYKTSTMCGCCRAPIPSTATGLLALSTPPLTGAARRSRSHHPTR